MRKLINIALIVLLLVLVGCSVLQSKRQDIIPVQPRVDYKDNEIIKEQAKANFKLSTKIREQGTAPESIEAITLENGSRIMVRFIGEPYKDVDGTNIQEVQKISKKADKIAEEHNKELAKFDDTLNQKREKQINQVNTYWDWRKIFAGGVFTWILVAVAVPILGAFFPVIIPFVSLFFQIVTHAFSAGIGLFSAIAKLGVKGLVDLFQKIEAWRDANKDTPAGQSFDAHLSSTLAPQTVDAVDKLKNLFKI